MAFTWSQVSAIDSGNVLRDITWADEISLFVGVGDAGLVLTSPTGAVWTVQTAAAANSWRGVAFNGTTLVAVSNNGVNRVMTSTDGIAWASQSASDASSWTSVTWSAGLSLFVAVASAGAGNRVMTSPDGVTWTGQAAASAQAWVGVTASPTLLVAVSSTNTGTQPVMTSTDGVTWTLRTTNGASNNGAVGATPCGSSVVVYSSDLGLFAFTARLQGVAVTFVYHSPDGVTWTRADFPTNRSWNALAWAGLAERFLCVAAGEMMGMSVDGATWTEEDMNQFRTWGAMAWSNTLARVVAFDIDTNNAMLLGVYALVGDIDPGHGTKRGGTVCTISGIGLEGTTAVTFGGTAATSVVAAADGTSVTCISPAHAVGAVEVVLS
jgi:hypothetical protein